MNTRNENLFLHALNSFPAFGPKRLSLLVNRFGNSKYAWEANQTELELAGLGKNIILKFLEFRRAFNLEESFLLLQKNKINTVNFLEQEYPTLLKEICLPPLLLYYKGSLPKVDQIYLASVGTRKPSAYGKLAAQKILPALIDHGIKIVSGLAHGIDALSHELAVMRSSQTYAILGSGLDDSSMYPKQNMSLAQKIISKGGGLISEYPPYTQAFKQNFIARNRIISGMSTGVLITECAKNSGSLITARYALEQNRNVYAVPGSIHSPESEGTNDLIKAGAIPVTSAEDILNDLHIKQKVESKSPLPDNPKESKILEYLKTGPKRLDEIINATHETSSEISSTLSLLEIKGHVTSTGTGLYATTI